MENKRKYVIPGDVITTGPYRPEQNVILDGNKIISTAIGISEIYDDEYFKIKLTAADASFWEDPPTTLVAKLFHTKSAPLLYCIWAETKSVVPMFCAHLKVTL